MIPVLAPGGDVFQSLLLELLGAIAVGRMIPEERRMVVAIV